jgi:hypothetical protein
MAGSVSADRVVGAVEQLVERAADDATVQQALGLSARELATWQEAGDAQVALRDVLRQRRFGTASSLIDGKAALPLHAPTSAERARLAEWLTRERLTP